MAILEWSTGLSVGNTELDNQHKKLIQMVNDFFDALKSGNTKELIEKSVPALYEYAGKHFADEEKYMQKIGYPGFAEHHAKHVELTQKVEKLITMVQTGQTINLLKVGNFLKDWIKQHIMLEDSQYANHAARQKVTT